MPELLPPWIGEIADLTRAANLITYDVDGGHRFRWESHGTTVYLPVGGEGVPLTTLSPWVLKVFPARGTQPYQILTLSVDVQADPDDPDEWIIGPTVPVRWQDAHHNDVPYAPTDSIAFADFVHSARRILGELLTPEQAWEAIEPLLLPPD